MKNFIKNHHFLAGLLSIFVSVFLVSIVAYGATTIGTNVTTEGYATSTTGLFTQANIEVGGNSLVRGKSTTTTAVAIGVGTISTLDMAGGDLYVLDDVEIGGLATTTGGLFTMANLDVGGTGTIRGNTTIGGYATSTTGFYSQGVLEIGGNGLVRGNITANGYATSTTGLFTQANTHIGGSATTSLSHYIGGTSSTTELFVQGDTHIGGSAVVGDLAIGTSTSGIISNFLFGTCEVDFSASLAIGEASSSDCTATGISAAHRVFVTPEWLEPGIVFQAASSTAGTIRIHVSNATTTVVTTGENTWQWMGIR